MLYYFTPSFLSTANNTFVVGLPVKINSVFHSIFCLILTEEEKKHLPQLYRIASYHCQCSHVHDPSTNAVNCNWITISKYTRNQLLPIFTASNILIQVTIISFGLHKSPTLVYLILILQLLRLFLCHSSTQKSSVTSHLLQNQSLGIYSNLQFSMICTRCCQEHSNFRATEFSVSCLYLVYFAPRYSHFPQVFIQCHLLSEAFIGNPTQCINHSTPPLRFPISLLSLFFYCRMGCIII